MGNKFKKGLAQYLHSATYAAVLAVGALGIAQQAGAQVVDTKHNLSATAPAAGSQGATRVNYYTGAGATTQVCVFCHTPHGAASAAAPLWQRQVKAATYYQTYGSVNASPTMDAEQGTGVTVGSVSLACLSCHDGTQAINTMANKPGSGNNTLGGDWASNNNLASGALGTSSMANLGGGTVGTDGKDLQNDHPIGIKYAGGFSYTVAGNAVTNGAFADPAFRATSSTVVNDVPVWYVEKAVGNTTGRDKNDIQLYTRSSGGSYQPYVECASCHDPHANAELFMRVPVAGSEICLTCHIK